MIYLDYAANTPVEKSVLDLYYEVSLKYFANPNSSHRLGLEAKKVLDESSENIAKKLGILKEEIIYTSGATESNNLVVKGICERYKNYGKHILLSSLEHNSLIESATSMQELGFEVELIPVNKDGVVEVDVLKSMLREDTILVSVCSIDSEIGIIQPIEEIANLLKEYPHTFFHTDASQAIGKIEMNYENVDLITIAPHKFYGLNGIGLLIKKKDVSIKPLINGGKSTTIYRSGTPVLPLVVATDKALSYSLEEQKNRYNYVSKLKTKITSELSKLPNIKINSKENSVPYIINFSFKGIKALDLAKKLEEYEIYVSTKTSCCPVETPSKLVYALTKDKGLATSSIRVSLSHLTTEEEVDEFINCFLKCYKEFTDNGKI